MFLAMAQVKIIDVEFQEAEAFVPAVPEVAEVVDTDPPFDIITPFQAEIPEITAVPQVDEESHQEVGKVFIELNAEDVVRGIESGNGLEYYNIKVSGANLQLSLQPVTSKSGPRTSGPATEIAEIEAGGQDIGSALVEV